MPQVIAWCDGGCRGNPGGPGGWGAVLVHVATGATLELRGGEPDTTNNRMELRAAIEALQSLSAAGVDIEVRCDSRYVVDTVEKWMPGWKRRGWKRREGGPVKNLDLVTALDALLARHRARFRWVRGHAGDPGNERADALANEAMDAMARGEEPGSSVRRAEPGFRW
jgi:ribonuclease HI